MNPITHARYLSTHSTTSLAKQLHISRQYISRVEQGLYDKPNKILLDWTATTINKAIDNEITPEVVSQLYKEWQWQQRESTKLNKALRPLTVTEYDVVRHGTNGLIYYHQIFNQWRSDYWNSSHAFCVDMCLHPSPVADYEEGETHTMPNQLKKVLTSLRLLGDGFKTHER